MAAGGRSRGKRATLRTILVNTAHTNVPMIKNPPTVEPAIVLSTNQLAQLANRSRGVVDRLRARGAITPYALLDIGAGVVPLWLPEVAIHIAASKPHDPQPPVFL